MSQREKVIAFIIQQQSSRFRVIDNTGSDKKIIGGQFPDIIFFPKEPANSTNALIVFKIENGSELVDSVPIWQGLGSAPSVLYIVVPKTKLDDVKKLAVLTGVRAKFGWYEMDKENVEYVNYE